MGIADLKKFLKDKHPEVIEPVDMAIFRGKKLAIDVSIYLFKYKTTFGENAWIRGFITFIVSLRSQGIHCMFVFDGVSLVDKKEEREARRQQHDKLESDIQRLRESIEVCERTGEVDGLISGFDGGIVAAKRFLQKKEKQCISISKEDFDELKHMFNILCIPWCVAQHDAETLCALLNRNGLVDAVLSDDSDVLAYRSDIWCFQL